MKQRAVFLDRDGTLVSPHHYPSQPEHLHLYEGIGAELRLLQEANFLLIIVTNQGGIARGYFTEADLQRMHEYLTAELEKLSVHIDGIYHCPHHPLGIIQELTIRCNCRKPQSGMVLQAAQEHDIDVKASWFVGDILDDIEAGNGAGCRSILVDLGTESQPTEPRRTPNFIARTTIHALQVIRAIEHIGPDADLTYHPSSWQQNAAPQPKNNISETGEHHVHCR